MPRSLNLVILFLTAIFLLGLFSTEIQDTDFWWHLKTGDYIATQKALPAPDPFAYTTYLGKPAYPGEEQTRYFNLTHEWLAQLMLWGTFRLAGPAGVILLRAILLTAFCGLVGYLAARRTSSFLWGIAAALAASSIAWYFAADRPALLTFFFLALFIVILETGRALWLLPVLSLIWANSHAGFFLGWIALAAYSLEVLLKKRDLPSLPWFALASFLISGLNPNFFGVIRTLIDYRASYLTSTLLEWKPPYLWGPPYAFDILLYLAALMLILSRRRVRLADWVLFIAFAAASLTAFRNIILIALIAPVLIAAYFPWKLRLPALSNAVIAVLLAIGIGVGVAKGAFFQLRMAEWAAPSKAVDFLLAHNYHGRLFNTYEYGGYLIWRLGPKDKVFIDGRALNESVYRDYQKILYTSGLPPTALLDQYGVEAIVINSLEYASGAIYPLALSLGNPKNTDWKLVYEDPQALIFLRNPPVDMPEIAKSRRVIDHIESECTVHIQHQPELSECARTFAELSQRAGDQDRARRMRQLYQLNLQ